MNENHLFDDDNPEQRGRGCDAICANDERLKFNWRRPVRIGGFDLKVHYRYTEYEAEVTWYREDLLHVGGFLTRLDAQLGAEQLLVDLRGIVQSAINNNAEGARAEAVTPAPGCERSQRTRARG